MNKGRVAALKGWFYGYVKIFKSVDEDLEQNTVLKEEHTERVCGEILNIGEKLGLNDQDLCLAEIIALPMISAVLNSMPAIEPSSTFTLLIMPNSE